MRIWCGRIALAGLVLISAGVLAQAEEKEEKIAIEKVPKSVLDAVKKRFPEAKLLSAERETEKDAELFEVKLEQKAEEIEVKLSADGAFLEIELEIKVKDIPKPVHDALLAKYPKSELEKAEQVTKFKDGKEQPEIYEVEVETADDKDLKVTVDADGKIIDVEEEDEDDDKDEDDGDDDDARK